MPHSLIVRRGHAPASADGMACGDERPPLPLRLPRDACQRSAVVSAAALSVRSDAPSARRACHGDQVWLVLYFRMLCIISS